MKILVIASKSPWPPKDGGRLALWNTLQASNRAGNQLHLIVPRPDESEAELDTIKTKLCTIGGFDLVPIAPRSKWRDAFVSILGRIPLTLVRHQHREMQQVIAARLKEFQPEVIHAEQLQAFANVNRQMAGECALVLRMQNVESELWEQTGRLRWWHWPLLWEAKRLLRHQNQALKMADLVLAITAVDATALGSRLPLDMRNKVKAWPPPFASALPAAPSLPGSPCVTLSGSKGWWPNDDAMQWFMREVLPDLRRRLPGVVVHVFGDRPIQCANVVAHAAPIDAIAAFPKNAICAVPLRVGSGIRMRILEAFARGLPVVTTTRGATGLLVQSNRELMIADTAVEFAAAIEKLHQAQSMQAAMIQAGQRYLLAHHDDRSLGIRLNANYQIAIENCRNRQKHSTSSQR